MQESLIDMIKFPESLILEQLYRKIQFLPKEDLKKLNKEYIYSHGFVSPKFNQYNAEQNENGSVWIGKLMPIEQCQEKALRTKNSSMQTYCDNGYAKILVYLPQLKR